MTDTIPEFLCITNVETEMDLVLVATGGFGRVYKSRYKGREVALKEVQKSRHEVSALPNNTADANSFWQGSVKQRIPARSHRVAIPLSPFYPSSLGNICREITVIPRITLHERRNVNSVEKRAGAGCN